MERKALVFTLVSRFPQVAFLRSVRSGHVEGQGARSFRTSHLLVRALVTCIVGTGFQ